MNASFETEQPQPLNRREAIRRVSALLGGIAFAGGSSLLAAAEKASPDRGVARPIQRPRNRVSRRDRRNHSARNEDPGREGGKDRRVYGADGHRLLQPWEQKVFREGMRKVDDAMRRRTRCHSCRRPRRSGWRCSRRWITSRSGSWTRARRRIVSREDWRRCPALPQPHACGHQSAGPLLSHDEGARDARLLHLEGRLHAGVALRRGTGPLRSLHTLHARRDGVGGACVIN